MRCGGFEDDSTKPSPCFIVHRVSDARPGPRCAAFSVQLQTISIGDRTSGRLRRSSRRCSPSSKTMWSNNLRFLLARHPSNEALTFQARGVAELVSPPASPVDCNLAGVESGRVCMTSFLERPRRARPGSLASRHRAPTSASKTRSRSAKVEIRRYERSTREWPRTPIGSEASSDAGSFRSRAPVAAIWLGVSR
jgi:hypothetical protein